LQRWSTQLGMGYIASGALGRRGAAGTRELKDKP
jgi:hypothetical protein